MFIHRNEHSILGLFKFYYSLKDTLPNTLQHRDKGKVDFFFIQFQCSTIPVYQYMDQLRKKNLIVEYGSEIRRGCDQMLCVLREI